MRVFVEKMAENVTFNFKGKHLRTLGFNRKSFVLRLHYLHFLSNEYRLLKRFPPDTLIKQNITVKLIGGIKEI